MTRKEYYKQWYLTNRNKQLKKMRLYAKLNPEMNKRSSEKYRTDNPEHRAYSNILYRCNNKNCHAYPSYGGRGIRVLYKSFAEFLSDVGKRPQKSLSIDRINNNGNYEVGNCRWATRKQQAANRRNSRRLNVSSNH